MGNITEKSTGPHEVTLNINAKLTFDSSSALYHAMFQVFVVLVSLLDLIFILCLGSYLVLTRLFPSGRFRGSSRIEEFLLGISLMYFIVYSLLHGSNFGTSETGIDYYLSKYIGQRKWDKKQTCFDCCSVNNYTYWYNCHEATPGSYCKGYSPKCEHFKLVDQINEKGLLPNATGQRKLDKVQTCFDCCGVNDYTYWLRHCVPNVTAHVNTHLKCCLRNRDELNVDGNVDTDLEEQWLIDNINTDINTENNGNINCGDVNGDLNRTIEMEDVLDVHQNNAADYDDELLE